MSRSRRAPSGCERGRLTVSAPRQRLPNFSWRPSRLAPGKPRAGVKRQGSATVSFRLASPCQVRPLKPAIAPGIGVDGGPIGSAQRGQAAADGTRALCPDHWARLQPDPSAPSRIGSGAPSREGAQGRTLHRSVVAAPSRARIRSATATEADGMADPPAQELREGAGWPSDRGPTSCSAQLSAFRARFPGRPPAIEAGAEAGQLLLHVPDQISFRLALLQHDQRAAMGKQRGLDQLRVQPRQPVSMLHHHRRHLGVREQPPQLGTMPAQARAHLRLHPDHRPAGLSRPLCQPCHLALKVGPLVMRGDPRIEAKADRRSLHDGTDVHQDGARPHPLRRHRQGAVLKPPQRGVGMDALPASPLGQVHYPYRNPYLSWRA